MTKYARGKKAWGTCMRGGHRHLLKDLVLDGHIKNLLVCKECYEPEHPQERPVAAYDPQTLRRNSPDTDKTHVVVYVGKEYDLTNDVIEAAPYAWAPSANGTVT
jgi:hypothetical protein